MGISHIFFKEYEQHIEQLSTTINTQGHASSISLGPPNPLGKFLHGSQNCGHALLAAPTLVPWLLCRGIKDHNLKIRGKSDGKVMENQEQTLKIREP